MKKLMALILAAALAFGSSVMVFADEEAAVLDNVPLNLTAVDFIGSGGLVTGRVPAFPGQAALTLNVSNFISDAYQDMINTNTRPGVFTGILTFDFTVEETFTTAIVEITALNMNLQPVAIRTLYIDKANNAELTAAQFTAMLDAELEALEALLDELEEVDEENGEEVEFEVVEIILIPLRATAEEAGFDVSWNAETARVTVSDGVLSFSLAAGSIVAINDLGDEFELEIAPVNLDGTMYVPVSFFTELLGVEILLLNDSAPLPVIEDEEVEDEEVVDVVEEDEEVVEDEEDEEVEEDEEDEE
ncbi:MAG: copper amine oxidase N-terminal domain-containing protein [Defluviitaleaceae bacterium]|nr:copper amine oxidase N-terminal domain-containing protein [Defluviitaleaceae bacterium]